MFTPQQKYLLGMFEDDFYGLWELDWTFNSSSPAIEAGERVAVVVPLFQGGLMHLFARNDIQENTDAFDSVTAAGLVADYRNWEAPTVEGELSYFFTTSEGGVQYLRDNATDGNKSD